MEWLSVKKKLTEKDVKMINDKFGIDLPDDFCRLIGPINGGALRKGYVELKNLGKIAYSRNVSLNIEAKSSIFKLYGPDSELDTRYFPFGSVGNGDYFCIDLKRKEIVLWMHETNRVIYVCKTFTQFLSMIQE